MIHYKYIKGMNINNSNDEAVNYYTFLNFKNSNSSPSVSVGTNPNSPDNWGDIVTTNPGEIQVINNEFHAATFYSTDEDLLGYVDEDKQTTALIGYSDFDDDSYKELVLKAETVVNGNIIVYHESDSDLYISAPNGSFTNKCEAGYFNSTSDIRAKTNIKPLNLKAIDLVCKTPVYSFVYKDLETPSIGIIAQEVQDIDIEGFKLVDNEEATGQHLDYMSIHESKLVYILWKAVQELHAEVEELKKNR